MMNREIKRVENAIRRRWIHNRNDERIRTISRKVAQNAPTVAQPPVIFFNASTRLAGLSLNAAFSLISSWAVRLRGVRVIHFVCRSGLTRCMLGSVVTDDPNRLPPCAECVAQSEVIYTHAEVKGLVRDKDDAFEAAVCDLSVPEMEQFCHRGVPLGELLLPAVRWVFRRHHLVDDEPTRLLYREYLISADQIVTQFGRLLDETQPQAVVVFNGMSYPEAVARWVAQQRGITVFTHEVGLQPFTAFFSDGLATAYPIAISPDFQLKEEQNLKLDSYLEQRFKGNFSMAGVQFWSEILPLGDDFWEKAHTFKQIVPVFSNVIFDTSQAHANVVFEHMFDWLDTVLELTRSHPETLFVFRAHPDEARPGKAAQESVAGWAEKNQITKLDNVVFVDASQKISSYELIQHSKFVMIYNSTIGMEATLLGTPVLCAGKARFTQIPTVYFPATRAAFIEKAEEMLLADKITIPSEFIENTRKFLYTQLYQASLPFDEFLEEDHVWKGYVRLKYFSWTGLQPGASQTLDAISQGILNGKPFVINR